MISPTQILAAGIPAGTSSNIEVTSNRLHHLTVRVLGEALTGGDVIVIQYLDSSGAWLPFSVIRETNTAITGQLTASNSAFVLSETGTYRAVKGITATATGVEIIA